eukprot:CAMPEP_0115697520 /NCGR_PEP_ID=MMETSP0272-20121206/65854_1 /TAXON_ID=71861 /ORGANISM="Scrippsiella trochoidea, Strain CCMP3099" /LENGTH=90 /DNA_ID=CAMNT_0003137813 /DNA_START=964 /DNA_END=1232 /DNA_ORIENTATION=+
MDERVLHSDRRVPRDLPGKPAAHIGLLQESCGMRWSLTSSEDGAFHPGMALPCTAAVRQTSSCIKHAHPCGLSTRNCVGMFVWYVFSQTA